MANFEEYYLKNGEKRWLFKTYLGKDVEGNVKQTTKRGFKTLSEAKKEEKQLQLEFLKNFEIEKEKLDNKSITFIEIYKKWFENYKLTVKESTWAKTERMFELHILPSFAHLNVRDIELNYAQQVLNEWFKHTKTKYKRLLNYTNNVLDYAIQLNYLDFNVLNKLIIPKVINNNNQNNNDKDNYYTKDELLDFLETLKLLENDKAYTLFYLLAFTGLRKGEILALNWSDIDFNSNTLTVSKTLTRGFKSKLMISSAKTYSSNRTISLDESTVDILKSWKIKQKEEFKLSKVKIKKDNKQLIFSNQNNEILSDAKPRKYLLQVQSLNPNLKFISVHGFRHTHCSLLFESGVSIKEVQKRLGHSDIQTTLNIYTHVSKQTEKETSIKFADYILKS